MRCKMTTPRIFAPVSLLAFCLVLASGSETVHRAWLMPGECVAVPVELGGNQLFQLLSESQKQLRMTSLIAQGTCLQRDSEGKCERAADDSFAACSEATSATKAAQLEGEMETDSRRTAFVYISNRGEHPTLLDLLVVLEPMRQTAGDAIQTAVGSYRRSLLDNMHSGSQTMRSVAVAAGEAVTAHSRSAHRRLLADTADVLANNAPTSSSTPTPSPSSSTRSNSDIIGRIQDQVPQSARKWVKIAVIIAIVLIALSILSCLICLIKCICWPCCCAARAFK